MQITYSDDPLRLKDQELVDLTDSSIDGQRVLSERNIIMDTSSVRSVASRTSFSRLSAAAQRRQETIQMRISKEKSRRRRMVRRIEYQRLRNMVPSIAKKPLVSKVTVIEEAIRYIDYLHEALLARLKTKGLPSCLQGANVDVDHMGHEDIKNLVCQLVEKNKKAAATAARNTSGGRNRRTGSGANSGRSSQRSRHPHAHLLAKLRNCGRT